MKLILPNGDKMELDNDISLEEKRKVVDDILDKWTPYFTTYRKNKKTEICLEVLSSYLCTHKDNDEEGANNEQEN